MALICETVQAATMADLRRARDRSGADLVELRLDGVADLDVAGALAGRTRPVLVTCRPVAEGGGFSGGEEERMRILGAAVSGGAEYVDVEWHADRRALPLPDRTRLVISLHDFNGIPEDLGAQIDAMRREAPSGVVKVAVAAGRAADLIKLHAAARDDAGDHVVIGMGAAGVLTRVCPRLFGSVWTYAGDAAPGQLRVEELAGMYRVREQTDATRRFALTGAPLTHSASPAMHNAAFAAAGIDAVYVPIESRDGRELLDVAGAFGIEGVSVTAPLKTAWAALGVELDEVAAATGAANTLKRSGGRWFGRNFDADAFMAPLERRGIELKHARCVVLGAGGAARAAVWALARAGAHVEVSARRADQAAALAQALGVRTTPWPPAPGWDLLVNATPVGTWPDVSLAPIPRNLVGGRAVYDLVYHPRETTLLAWARESGAEVVEGFDMLVSQACRQFEYWTGLAAPAAVMRRAGERFLLRTTGR